MEKMPIIDGKVDEKWLDAVLRENAIRASSNMALTEDFGAVCLRFTDAVICDDKFGFKNLDKLTKAEACCRVYLHMCENISKYDRAKCDAPSNWLYTVVKHRMIQAVNEFLRSNEVSEAVAAVVGLETIAKMDGLDRNAPAKVFISEKVDALKDFKFDRKTKENIFRQTWRESWFRRDGRTVLNRAKRHKQLQAAKVACQAWIPPGSLRDGLKHLLEERQNGRN